MEAKIRAILEEAVREPERSGGLFTVLMDRFDAIGGVELDLPPRSTPPRAADLAS
jgi:antitoxin FitA